MTQTLDTGPDGVTRCWWASQTEAYRHYHDTEWGRPTADDRWLFEKICLEGFQSGLSWRTILEKREAFREAFANFDANEIAQYGEAEVEALLQNAAIVRHRRKIESTINNARRMLELRADCGSLAQFVWQFAPPPAPLPSGPRPAKTAESIALAKALKARGWSFVGPTTAYAFMQAAGLVNDHAEGCAVGAECAAERAAFKVPR